MSKLEEKFRPHVKIWDCYNDVPEEENHAAKCVEITEQECIGFAEWVSKSEINGQYYSYSRDNIWHGYYNPDERHYNPLTTQQLFQLYQKEQRK